MIMSDIGILQQSWPFNALSDEGIHRIKSIAKPVKFNKGQLIFVKDDQADAVYMILEGEISIEILSPEGRSVSLTVLGKGETFGELAVLDEGTRTADAKALVHTRLMKIPKTLFLELTASEPPFAIMLIKGLIRKLRSTDNQVENISLRPLKIRVALLLCALAEAQQEERPVLKLTQSALADRLSATREKVNINLQSLQQTGAIALGRGKIEIIDLQKLRAITTDGQ